MVNLKFSPGGCLIEQGEYSAEFMRMFIDFVGTAPDDVRQEIEKQMQKGLRLYSRHYDSYCDSSHSVSLGHYWRGWGDNLLYVWFNSEAMPFYVGKAKYHTSRPTDVKYRTRSVEFQNVVRGGGCHVAIIATNIPDSKIDELERDLIAYCAWKQYPLVNKRDLPSVREVKMAVDMSKRTGNTIEDLFLSQIDFEYESEMKSIFDVLKNKVGVSWTGEYAELEKCV